MKRVCPTCQQAWAYMDARAAMGTRGPVPGKAGRSTGRKPRLRRQTNEEMACTPGAGAAPSTKKPAGETTGSTHSQGAI